MHIYFKNKKHFEDEFPDMSYDSQLNYFIKQFIKYIKIPSSNSYVGEPIVIRLRDINHADYFINFMFKFGKELNLKVTYDFWPPRFELQFWFQRQ
jgi:hypothetical protein